MPRNEAVNEKVNDLLDQLADMQMKHHTVIDAIAVKRWLQEIKRVNK